MGTVNFIWNLTKNYFTFGLIGLTISDRYASIVPIGGISISPTLILLVAFDSLYIAARTLQVCVGFSESSAFMSPK